MALNNSVLKCLRFRDALFIQGPPLVGVACSLPSPAMEHVFPAALFALASYLLALHGYAFNDWVDARHDARDANKQGHSFGGSDLSSGRGLALVVGLGVLSIAVFAVIQGRLAILAAIIVALGVLYSFPVERIQGKHIPVYSSVLHIAGATLYFLLGYLLFGHVDPRGLLIGGYFAVLVGAGHLAQEVQDRDGDARNNIRTNAVYFGGRPVFLLSCAAFSLSYLYVAWLARTGWLPWSLQWVAAVWPLHLFLMVRAWRAGLGFAPMWKLRRRYQFLFAGIALAFCAAVLLDRLA